MREIEVTSPLGKGVLLFHRMAATEYLGGLSEFHLDLLSEDSNIQLQDILGHNMTVQMNLPGDKTRYFDGHVSRFCFTGHSGRYACYQATVRPWFWLLTRTADCRIFQEKTVPEIIEEIFRDLGFTDFKKSLTGNYRKWVYCVQYRETDFNFISRLMEYEGIYYYFEHEDSKHTLVLADSYSAHDPIIGTPIPYLAVDSEAAKRRDHVSEWSVYQEIQPGTYALNDFDFEVPKPPKRLLVKSSIKRGHPKADYEVYDYPGTYVKNDDGSNYARARIEALQAEYERGQGQTEARGIAVGGLFKLSEHPREDQNREYLIVSATHQLQVDQYASTGSGEGGLMCQCRFVAMDSQQPYRSPRVTPKPVVQGSQTATVVGKAGEEIWTDKYGRVKVQFHWDRYGKSDENSSCWVRVSHPWAGKNWGAVSIPRIGQEVIVDFLEGDPDQPIITGRIYNADCMPPYPLPGGAVVSGIKSNTHKGKGYNEMSMDDTTGKEKITIHGQYDMGTTVEHDQTNTVNNDFTETIKKNASITISEGTYTHDVKTGTADYHVQDALTEKYDATQATTVKSNITITSTGGEIVITSDAKHVHVNAETEIQLKVGLSTIKMEADGKIKIDGKNVAIEGSESVSIHGEAVRSSADKEHEISGAVVKSDGSTSNTVKGTMVMLNP